MVNSIEQTEKDKKALAEILNQLELRKSKYGIVNADLTRIPQQKQLFKDMKDRLEVDESERARFYLYYG